MSELPAGVVTFLFTDIEGSTRLHQRLGIDYVQLRQDHDALLSTLVAAHDGVVVSNTGDGLFVAFSQAAKGITAAAATQRALGRATFRHAELLRVRMGLHTGAASPSGGDYTAVAVHQAARVCAAAHGGQVLLTPETAASTDRQLGLRSLGLFRLKDFEEAIELLQLTGEDLADAFPAPRAIPYARHNLPTITSTFIGREHDAAAVSSVLKESRVVTLTGPGGIGKTRLALGVAEGAAADFPDGIWLVRLALVDGPAQVAQAFARTLGVREQQGAPIIETIADALYGRRLLLVVDNCEHVVEAAAQAVDAVTARCPNVRVLATSREPLRIDDEAVVAVHPLPVPSVDSTEERRSAASVALFVDRAARAGHIVDEAELDAVVEICRRVEGVPLAIELAAARHPRLEPSTTHAGRTGAVSSP